MRWSARFIAALWVAIVAGVILPGEAGIRPSLQAPAVILSRPKA